MPAKKTVRPEDREAQTERFIQAARELGCDGCPDAFEAAVKKVAWHKSAAEKLDHKREARTLATVSVINCLRLTVSAVIATALPASIAFASENWPGSYLHWPRIIVGHPDRCPDCWYIQPYIIYSHRPVEVGHLFQVDPYGEYFFKICAQLANFVNNGVLETGVEPLSGKHVLIALRNIPYTAGIVHDDMFGDGFVFMAPRSHPVGGGFALSKNRFVRHHSPHYVAYLRKRNALLSVDDPRPASQNLSKGIECGVP